MDDKCGCGCGTTLDARAVSEYFATEGCQRRWNRRRAGLPVADADPLDAVLDAIRAAAERRRNREAEPVLPPARWRSVGHTVGGGQIYTAPAASIYDEIQPAPHVARWWSYRDPPAAWFLMESRRGESRAIYAVTDEAARHIHAPGAIEEHLRRRFGGHIPPLPTRYMD